MANNAVSTNLKNYYNSIISKNPLYFNHQFIITFEGADLPDEFKSDPSNPGALTYYVQSSSIPAINIEEQTVNFLGQDFVVPKGVTHGGSWQVTVTNISSLRHYTALRAWIARYADLNRNGGGNKTIPNIIAKVHVIDSTMQNSLHDFILEGVFPANCPDMSMQYETAAQIPNLPINFTYQYMYRSDEGDPLSA